MDRTRGDCGRFIWCLWGALLASVPCTIRSSVVALFDVPALVCPLQFQVEPLSLAVIALTLNCLFVRGDLSAHVTNTLIRCYLVVACLSLPMIVLCEAVWLPMRLGDFSFLGWQPLAELVEMILLSASFVCWVLYGRECFSGEAGGDYSRTLSFLRRTLCVSVGVPLLAMVISLLLPAWIGLMLCVLSGIAVFRSLHLAANQNMGGSSLMIWGLVLFGGLLVSSAIGRVISEALVLHPMNLPTPSLHGSLLMAATILAIASLALFIALRFLGQQEGFTHTPRQGLQIGDLLSSIPGSESLSGRQRDVLALRLDGAKGAAVAKKLGIGPGTVSTFQKRALKTLGYERLSELTKAINARREEELAKRECAELEENKRIRRIRVATLCIAVSMPLTMLAPFPYWEGVLPAAIAISTIAGVSRLIMLVPVGQFRAPDLLGGGEGALSVASAISLGISLSKGAYSFLDIFSSEILLLLTIVRLFASGLRTGEKGYIDFIRSLDNRHDGLRSALPILILLVGSSALLGRIVVFGADYYCIPRNLADGLTTVLTSLQYLCIGASALSLSLPSLTSVEAHSDPIGDAVLDMLKEKGLSDTELNTMVLIASGLKRGQISKMLHIAIGTINGARATGYRKLGVHSADELRELIRKSADR